MNKYVKAFTGGFLEGARETPRGFFAPVLTMFQWMGRVTEAAMHPPRAGDLGCAAGLARSAERGFQSSARQIFESAIGGDPSREEAILAACPDRNAAAAWLAKAHEHLEGRNGYELLAAGEHDRVYVALRAAVARAPAPG